MAMLENIIARLEQLAPSFMAEDWDNSGLQVGSLRGPCQVVVVALDVTPKVIQRAADLQANLIVSHHPLIFNQLTEINHNTPIGDMITSLIKEDINVFTMHTNYDVAPSGLNFHLAKKLGLVDAEVLAYVGDIESFKLVVFVPIDHSEQVLEAMWNSGAGQWGNYHKVSFQSRGVGTFIPGSDAKPFIGEVGRLEQVDEQRIELLVSSIELDDVLQAMQETHPYEEIAYDLLPLPKQGRPYGLGRVGELVKEQPLIDFAQAVAKALEISPVNMYGAKQKPIKRVAICGGSGGSLIDLAIKKKADVLVTGDIGYHQVQEAMYSDLALIDAGHIGTEAIFISAIADYLKANTQAQIITTEPDMLNKFIHEK